MSWLSPYILKTGDRRISLSFYSDEDKMTVGNSATVCVLPEPFVRYVFYIFLPYLILVFALGYVFKSRFGKDYRLVLYNVAQDGEKLSFTVSEKLNPKKIGFRSFVPYIRNKTYVGGIKVAAYGVFRKRFYIRSARGLLSFAIFDIAEIERGDLTLPETRKKGLKKSHIVFSAGEAVLLKTRDGFVCVAARKRKDRKQENTAEKNISSEISDSIAVSRGMRTEDEER